MSPQTARTEVLARIRSALRREESPADGASAEAPAPEVPAEAPAAAVASAASAAAAQSGPAPADPSPHPDGAALIELLTDRLIDYDASVALLPAAAVPARIAELLAGARTVVVPHDLDPAHLAALSAEVLPDSAETPLDLATLDAVDAVVTASTAAVADTGTIVLSGPQCGRRAITLVPDRHICLVRTADIVNRVPAAVRIIEERGLVERPQTWVSGPSATSDIELERVAGVHGPRTLDVILVTD